MGFNPKHLDKYLRWVKHNRAEYRDNRRISAEYARICRKADIALLMNNKKKAAEYTEKKDSFILGYLREKCSETIEK